MLAPNRITMLMARFGIWPPIEPMKSKIDCTPPHQLSPLKIAITAPIAAISSARKVTLRYSERQNQVRRRATTSSSATSRSTPYMLGHGRKRRAHTSTSPRNAITAPAVARIAGSSDRPSRS